LNALVHPVVHADFKKYLQSIEAPYLVYENAILFESGADAFCDYIILVTAPVEERIRRVIQRDGTSEEQVRARIGNQMPDEKKNKLADYILLNTDRDKTRQQVMELHQYFSDKYGS
jgi:dephospho-CoA kinase